MIAFPNIDPVVLQLGPLAIRWYSLAYVAGIVIGYHIIKRLPLPRRRGQQTETVLNSRSDVSLQNQEILQETKSSFLDDLMLYAILGIVLGGRLGYVLIYRPGYYIEHPQEILMLWHGGMSFHGGFAGILAAVWLFCRKHNVGFLAVVDRLAIVTPIGLFFGRIANFINGELWGRVTDAPWGMVFPTGGPLPRHPSQLYQAGMEGLLLGLVLWWAYKRFGLQRTGLTGGIFVAGYGVARSIGECFREPDAQIGFLPGGITMGQLLCVPMLGVGIWLILRALRRPHEPV